MSSTVMPVPFKTAARIQMDLMLRLRRVLGILVGCAGAALILEIMQAKLDAIEPTPGAFTGIRFLTVSLLALAWGAGIWRNEAPKNRTYFLSHPIDASLHELARVAAGAMWLLIAIAGAVVVALIGAAVRHNAGAGTLAGPASWVGLFTGSLLIYLMVGAISTLTGRVVEVLIGIYAAVVLVIPLLAMAGWGKAAGRIFNMVLVGKFGLKSALVAPAQESMSSIGVWLASMAIWYTVAGMMIVAVLGWRRRRLAPR
jgi:hypothetical protein